MKSGTLTLSKPTRTEEVLTALAARYPPGSAFSLSTISDVGGVSRPVAGTIRNWARSVNRWPYVDGRPGWARQHGYPATSQHLEELPPIDPRTGEPMIEQCPFEEADFELLMDRIIGREPTKTKPKPSV